MSAIFTAAARAWSDMRTEYETYIARAYDQALEGCQGVLVNAEGRALRIDGYDLFTGPRTRAYKYASWELTEWWHKHPRLTMAEFEAQWLSGTRFLEEAVA